MIKNEPDFRTEAVLSIAQKMSVAARTAPKAKGFDFLEIAVLDGDDIKKISGKMLEIGERENNQTFIRDSKNILSSQAVVIIGTRKKTVGLRYCGLCGFKNCAENEKNNGICVFNPGDLGIAVGSAVSVAAAHHIDNRVMYTIGMASIEMKLIGEDVKIAYGIPLSVSGKNPFFDR
ncbi:ferredoxin [candidate division WOR-1 bacterium RIFOXYA12_FULL_43_27]|uniref:Ferredoxin n=1 Tax=candidate division WOR-1 bacterium RIFOXYC2_FULL_46_14 TaxID=1802587 RepID=A0A1F4U5D5_UNCSA|nr:MAG: ferredoxin [candidate division WOR-1 bacterium RIFOXYA12_FULL_43_27]OGC20264.1 MAG: ferredoxin [candidate division WOR-1 bacterium RIFOXYB2_FULL_46_45]OGC31999.1 MAG: ferredoxin [candidate division WOR-1 bacterium RIFOXYA2_FULL_46_56]OGC40111.1 MAG: ferredoxin [candidate division WOR-1 bacterium RIFOXYC2_FULL_46_14]